MSRGMTTLNYRRLIWPVGGITRDTHGCNDGPALISRTSCKKKNLLENLGMRRDEAFSLAVFLHHSSCVAYGSSGDKPSVSLAMTESHRARNDSFAPAPDPFSRSYHAGFIRGRSAARESTHLRKFSKNNDDVEKRGIDRSDNPDCIVAV